MGLTLATYYSLSEFPNLGKEPGAFHSTKISGHLGVKLNGTVRSNRRSFEKIGPPLEVDHFFRLDRPDRNGPFHLGPRCAVFSRTT